MKWWNVFWKVVGCNNCNLRNFMFLYLKKVPWEQGSIVHVAGLSQRWQREISDIIVPLSSADKQIMLEQIIVLVTIRGKSEVRDNYADHTLPTTLHTLTWNFLLNGALVSRRWSQRRNSWPMNEDWHRPAEWAKRVRGHRYEPSLNR